jgi:uncharacterized membrane protein YkgB
MHKKKDSTNIVQKEIEFKPKARAWQKNYAYQVNCTSVIAVIKKSSSSKLTSCKHRKIKHILFLIIR